MRFTHRYIESLQPKAKRYVEYEENARGNGSLGVRVSTKGTKSWVHMYYVDGKVRMSTLGRFPRMSVAEAHKAFADAALAVAEGGDPARAIVADNKRRREAPRVTDLADLYMEKWAKPRKKSWRKDEAMLAKHVLPAMGDRRVGDIRRRDIVDLLDGVVAAGAPIQANRVLALVRKMFNFALTRDLVEFNPCQAVPRPSKERRKDRMLNDEELRVLLGKVPELKMWTPTQLALLFLLLTAQRPGEVLAAEWVDIDLEGRWWTIPAAKAKTD